MGILDRIRRRTDDSPDVLAAVESPADRPARAPSLAISASWLQPYTFRASDHEVRLVGESNYQDHLEFCAGGRTEDGARVPLVTAVLVAEPNNPYDNKAIRVDVGGRCVGYIARDETHRFHPILRQLASVGRPASCRALITGGWDRGNDDRGSFGVILSMHATLEITDDPCLLPFGRGRVSLVGEEACQDRLEALLGIRDRAEVVVTLEDDGTTITALLGGEPVGRLTPKMAERYRPMIQELLDAGYSDLRCEGRVIRGQRKIDTFLKLAKPWARAG
jgi:hypothetical protein